MDLYNISHITAKTYADEKCEFCKGEGRHYADFDVDDRREVYCVCAKENMEEAKAESQEDK